MGDFGEERVGGLGENKRKIRGGYHTHIFKKYECVVGGWGARGGGICWNCDLLKSI